MLIRIILFSLSFFSLNISCQLKQLTDQLYPYELPISINESKQALLTLCLGTPRQCLNFKLASNVDTTFVTRKTISREGYTPSASSSFVPHNQEKLIKLGLSTITGEIISDILIIPGTDIMIPDFNLVLVEDLHYSSYVGVIGLASVYYENPFSIIQSLYNNHYLTKKMFSITYTNTNKRNKSMCIGDVGQVKTKEYKSCSLIEMKTTKQYECRMNSVIYYNEYDFDGTPHVYQESQNVVFSPGSSFFVCPKGFFDFMLRMIFGMQISHTECFLKQDEDKYTSVVCSKSILTHGFGELIFVFGKWNIKIPFIKLFRQDTDGRNYYLAIKTHNSINNWMFGYDLFERYLVVFDLEEQSVHIKTNSNAINSN